MTISKEYFEQTLTNVKCFVKSCDQQAIFIEEIQNLESPLTKKIHIEGFVILCREHYSALFHNKKGGGGKVISFMNEKGKFVCTRCKKSWVNAFINQGHHIPITCKHCTNIRWRKPYVTGRFMVGEKRS